jgi:hypothetical protein
MREHAGDQLDEDDAESEDVRGRGRLRSMPDLRRGVRGADAERIRVLAGVEQRRGHAEVTDLDAYRGARQQEQVLRPQVQVNHPLRVAGGQPGSDLRGDRAGLGGQQPAAPVGQQPAQGRAVDQLHHQAELARSHDDILDGDHALVAQAAQRRGLLAEHPANIRVGRQVGTQHPGRERTTTVAARRPPQRPDRTQAERFVQDVVETE